MELKTLSVSFEALLRIDMDDVEVLEHLTHHGYPIAEWITTTYHIRNDNTKKKIEKTLIKISLVMNDILTKRKAMLETRVKTD